MKVTRLSEDCICVKAKTKSIKVIPLFDVHFDSKHCRRDLLKKHLNYAKEIGALVYFGGDFLDVMGHQRDPRSMKGDIREEYDVANYLDVVVNDAVKFLEPYGDIIVAMFDGNHETNILKRQETDVTQRIVDGINSYGHSVERMLYTGWIRWSVKTGSSDHHYVPFYNHVHHGYGGNAPRSKGTLKVDIDAANYPDADIISRGHIHQDWVMMRAQQRLSSHGNIFKKTIYHVQHPSYKDPSNNKGWGVEKGFSPCTVGTYEYELTGGRLQHDKKVKIVKLD